MFWEKILKGNFVYLYITSEVKYEIHHLSFLQRLEYATDNLFFIIKIQSNFLAFFNKFWG